MTHKSHLFYVIDENASEMTIISDPIQLPPDDPVRNLVALLDKMAKTDFDPANGLSLSLRFGEFTITVVCSPTKPYRAPSWIVKPTALATSQATG